MSSQNRAKSEQNFVGSVVDFKLPGEQLQYFLFDRKNSAESANKMADDVIDNLYFLTSLTFIKSNSNSSASFHLKYVL